ncbi:hypothetical protein JHK86_019036 [Glycine max]|nr:hypothetical protein JHK86_019036 [Glycine max]
MYFKVAEDTVHYGGSLMICLAGPTRALLAATIGNILGYSSSASGKWNNQDITVAAMRACKDAIAINSISAFCKGNPDTKGTDEMKYYGGWGGGRHGWYCPNGCCKWSYYYQTCWRCCYYLGEHVDAFTDAEPHN